MDNDNLEKLQKGLEMTELDINLLDQDYVFSILMKTDTLSFVHLLGQFPDEHLAPLSDRLLRVKVVVPSYLKDLTTTKRLYSKAIASVLADYLVFVLDSTTFH